MHDIDRTQLEFSSELPGFESGSFNSESFEFDNEDRRARVGALVHISLAGSAPVESVVVPASALLDRSGTPTVVVKTGPETFELRAIAVGPKSAGAVGITAGVSAGERVVVDGAMAVVLAAGG